MQRTAQIIQIVIPLNTHVMGGEQPVTAQQMVNQVDDTGRTTFSVHNTLPLVGADFTPDLLATINARLAPLGLALTPLPA